jgi:hypothetical protein
MEPEHPLSNKTFTLRKLLLLNQVLMTAVVIGQRQVVSLSMFGRWLMYIRSITTFTHLDIFQVKFKWWLNVTLFYIVIWVRFIVIGVSGKLSLECCLCNTFLQFFLDHSMNLFFVFSRCCLSFLWQCQLHTSWQLGPLRPYSHWSNN